MVKDEVIEGLSKALVLGRIANPGSNDVELKDIALELCEICRWLGG
jgi:hypothetical protein